MPNEDADLPIPPTLPPRPRMSDRSRRRLTREWLIRCGQNPSEHRIEALLKYAGQYKKRTLYGRLSDELVRNNQLPVNGQRELPVGGQ